MSKKNRRVMYSKICLQQALITLLNDQDLTSISVKKLCQQAEVNRSTFYAHYQNTSELLAEIEDQLLHDINEGIFYAKGGTSRDDLPRNIEKLLLFLEQNRELYITLCHRSPTFTTKATERAMEMDILARSSLGLQRYAYLCTFKFVIDGLFSVVLQWLEQVNRLPAARITPLFCHLLDNTSPFSEGLIL
ncbi:TetR/AcrR family transcriptional regulator [Neobacillus vireti]|uniref:TetR/AcrR family transcriptional regulator n=1 Tax=Neobacillus vireti TaxID=220686 RepID=UPI002FFFC8A5